VSLRRASKVGVNRQRRAPEPDHVCRICHQRDAGISFEHVPPRAAFNDRRARVSGFEDWLQRAVVVVTYERAH